MSLNDLETHELEDTSGEHPHLPPGQRGGQRPPPAAIAVIAAALILALGATLFAAIATSRGARTSQTAPRATATVAPIATGATVAPVSPLGTAAATSTVQAPVKGAGLPEGVQPLTFTLTGPNQGWATGALITNPVEGMPDQTMIYRYNAGTWTQVGPSIPSAYLGGLDMISPTEGWAIGGDSSGSNLLLHINGNGWRQEQAPGGNPQSAIYAIAMRSVSEGWMAITNPKGATGGLSTNLYEESGGNWTQVNGAPYIVTDIAPIASGEAWVIGQDQGGASSLYLVQGGNGTRVLTSPGNSAFSRLRVFAPNDIWIEGAMHAASNADINDLPLVYHYDGVAWSSVDLRAPDSAQHASVVSGSVAWSYLNTQLPPSNETAYGVISSIFSNAGGQWKAIPVPYSDLQSMTVVSTSSADVWALGVYVVTVQVPNSSGAASFASSNYNVLLHYSGGAWTEWGR